MDIFSGERPAMEGWAGDWKNCNRYAKDGWEIPAHTPCLRVEQQASDAVRFPE